MTYKEAVQLNGFAYNEYGEIEATTYADHVLRSQKECTHHTGIMPCYSVEEIESEEGEVTYATVSRSSHSRGYSIDQEFETEDEANNYFFNQIEKYDFDRDDQRNTEFFSTMEEANESIAQRYADDNSVAFNVAVSILRKIDILKANSRI